MGETKKYLAILKLKQLNLLASEQSETLSSANNTYTDLHNII